MFSGPRGRAQVGWTWPSLNRTNWGWNAGTTTLWQVPSGRMCNLSEHPFPHLQSGNNFNVFGRQEEFSELLRIVSGMVKSMWSFWEFIPAFQKKLAFIAASTRQPSQLPSLQGTISFHFALASSLCCFLPHILQNEINLFSSSDAYSAACSSSQNLLCAIIILLMDHVLSLNRNPYRELWYKTEYT